MSAEPLLIDRDEAARVLRCSPDMVDRMVASGQLPAIRFGSADTGRFRPEDLVELVERAGRLTAADRLEQRAGELQQALSAVAERYAGAVRQVRESARSGGDVRARADADLALVGTTTQELKLTSGRVRAAALAYRVDGFLADLLAAQEQLQSERERLFPAGTDDTILLEGSLGAVLGGIDRLTETVRSHWGQVLRAAEREAAGAGAVQSR